MAAADRFPIIGYHMPFPAAGFIKARDDGFRFVPVGQQLLSANPVGGASWLRRSADRYR